MAGDLADGAKWCLRAYYYAVGAVLGFWLAVYHVYVREVRAGTQYVYDTFFSPSTKDKVKSKYYETKPKFENAINSAGNRIQNQFPAKVPDVPKGYTQRVK